MTEITRRRIAALRQCIRQIEAEIARLRLVEAPKIELERLSLRLQTFKTTLNELLRRK